MTFLFAAFRLISGNRLVQVGLLGVAALLAWNWRYHEGYRAADKACVARIQSIGDKGRLDQAKAAELVLHADAGRADAARQQAERRAAAAERALAAARRNNRGVCLTTEVTDAIRAIPAPEDQ